MTTLTIDTVAARSASRRLRATSDGIEELRTAITGVARLAAFTDEHLTAWNVAGELRDEVGLIGHLLGLTADRSEQADGDYAGMLDQWLGTTIATLRSALNTGSGPSVRSFLATAHGAMSPGAIAALTPDEAAAWWATLPPDRRLELAATEIELFEGTAVAGAIDSWIDRLDGATVRELYEMRAFDRAGIDPEAWNPDLGLAANAHIVEAVYEYYADLYRSHPDRLWWSGMAALIGPSFYGGFRDLDTFRSLLGGASTIAESPARRLLPPQVQRAGELAEMSADVLSAELLWYQVRLLRMQREIFLDMAPAHEAYLDGGIERVEQLLADDPYGFGAPTIEAWRTIDAGWRAGDQQMIAAGNETLLLREQRWVIADDYDKMRERPVTGELVTWAMTLVGAPSVPGARTYPEVFPLVVDLTPTISTPDRIPVPVGPFRFDVDVPQLTLEAGAEITTPLPAGNISDFNDRWNLIAQDTLPTYVSLARDHPDAIIEILDDPVGERADEYTIGARFDEILLQLITSWEIDPRVAVAVGE